jgi:3,4-dihydroxy 2-butanone 4-phosphate synthase
MFSGYVADTGTIARAEPSAGGVALTILAPVTAATLRAGDSVAVAGVRLTVTEADEHAFSTFAGEETAQRTTLRPGRASPGRRVNLEAPLRLGDPVNGHYVQGHVDGVARVSARREGAGVVYLWFRPNKRVLDEVVPKGSVAVDGVSLTVVEVNKGAFSVALIPETRRRTTLADLAEGDSVNVETDLFAKYVQRFGRPPREGLAWSGLRRGVEAVEKAIATIAAGGMVLVWDPAREGEADVIMAGDRVRPADINFFMTHVRGLLCVPADAALLARLGIERIPGDGDHHGTAFMVPVDAAEGTTTGIPASERAHTIRLMASPEAGPADFVRPGHVFPLAADPGGLTARPGHTEASVALARWAGRPPVALCCEVAATDGEMARLPELELFSAEHGLPMVAIDDLVEYARTHDPRPAELLAGR